MHTFILVGDLHPLAARLEAEGHDVILVSKRKCYNGMLKHLTEKLPPQIAPTSIVIQTCETPYMKEGHRVMGWSAKTQEVMDDASKAYRLARSLGLQAEKAVAFKDLQELLKFLASNGDQRWRMEGSLGSYTELQAGDLHWALADEKKSSISVSLHAARSGEALDFEEVAWWTGSGIARNFDRIVREGDYTYVQTRLRPRNTIIDWEKMIEFLDKSGYVGPVGVNVHVSAANEITFASFRFGFDLAHTLCRVEQMRPTLGDFFALYNGNAAGNPMYSCCVTPRLIETLPGMPIRVLPPEAVHERAGLHFFDVTETARGLKASSYTPFFAVGTGNDLATAKMRAHAVLRRIRVAAHLAIDGGDAWRQGFSRLALAGL